MSEETDEIVAVKEEPVEGSKKLFIIFGGIAANIAMPPFEFYRSSQILGENRVFIRDLRQTWYHNGIDGHANDIPGIVTFLEDLRKKYDPEQMTLVGNSMGGFAAILFSMLLGDCRAIAFAPQTFIGPLKRLGKLDFRWPRPILRTYRTALVKKKFFDLAATTETRPGFEIDIFVSSLHQLDLAHANEFKDKPSVRIHTYEIGGHNLVRHLRDQGDLKDILNGSYTGST